MEEARARDLHTEILLFRPFWIYRAMTGGLGLFLSSYVCPFSKPPKRKTPATYKPEALSVSLPRIGKIPCRFHIPFFYFAQSVIKLPLIPPLTSCSISSSSSSSSSNHPPGSLFIEQNRRGIRTLAGFFSFFYSLWQPDLPPEYVDLPPGPPGPHGWPSLQLGPPHGLPATTLGLLTLAPALLVVANDGLQ